MSVTGVNPFEPKEPKQGRIVVSPKEKRTIDGIVFASAWEGRCYKELRDAFKPGTITLQPKFLLQPGFKMPSGESIRPVQYFGDFMFGPERRSNQDALTDEHTVIDSKGWADSVFLLKRKWFLYVYRQPLHTPKRVKDLRDLIEFLKQKYPNQAV